MNINRFLSSFPADLARPCNFTVQLNPPQKFINALNELKSSSTQSPQLRGAFGSLDSVMDLRNLCTFRCEQAELPPRAFTLINQKTYGPLEEYPVQNSYNKSAMVFICGGDMKEKLFFDLWMEMICTTHPSYNYAANRSVRFDFEYKSNYVSDVIVRQYGVDGKPIYGVALRDAFPAEVYSLPLSWHQPNDYHRLNVMFSYRYFYTLNDPAGGENF